MTSSDPAAQAVTLLGVRRSDTPALRSLDGLVRGRLADEGMEEAYESFLRDPADGSLVRFLLQEQIRRDAMFADRLREAVERAGSAASAAPTVSQNTNADRGSIVTVGGEKATTKVWNGDRTIKTGGGAALLVVLLVGLYLFGRTIVDGGQELTADSTCSAFNAADAQTQRSSVLRIAEEMDVDGLGPLTYPNVPYECSYNPSEKTLGDVIGSMRKN